MKIAIVSLFPDMFTALDSGVPGRAIKNKLLELSYYNPRDYTLDAYKRVDDRPYGGGPGMVMMIEPLQKAIQDAQKNQKSKVIYVSPRGKPFNQEAAKKLSQESSLVFVSGRYEGIDERVISLEIDEEWSLGDYVISGGELASMVMVDAIIRLLPGALGDADSAEQDSFSNGLLDCPHYTRPEEFQGQTVPKILLSGDHQAIKRWRMKQSLGKTWQMRRDLIERISLNSEQKHLLEEYITEYDHEHYHSTDDQ